MNTFKIHFADGNTLVTSFNGTLFSAATYYLGQYFNVGQGEMDNLVKCIRVEEVK